MNLIIEFIGIYLIMGIVAVLIYIVFAMGYLFIKLYPNYNKLVEFNRHIESDINENKSKSNAIIHWLNVLFMWPYRITMAVYDIHSTIKKITT